MLFRRPPPIAPVEPAAVLVFKAFAAALARRDWAEAGGFVADRIDVRWHGCAPKGRFTDRDSYIAAWKALLSRDSNMWDIHSIFGNETRVAVEFTRSRLNGTSVFSGTIICDVAHGVIVREVTHEVPI